jgi:hypothetical protein
MSSLSSHFVTPKKSRQHGHPGQLLTMYNKEKGRWVPARAAARIRQPSRPASLDTPGA